MRRGIGFGPIPFVVFRRERYEVSERTNKRKIGENYEKVAGEYLKSQGYEIIEYNFYTRGGEIDIIAKHKGYFVFVEVKYRKNDKKGNPLEAISMQKQRSISKCAAYYLKKHNLYDVPVRFDVVGILGEEIQLIQNAFDFVA